MTMAWVKVVKQFVIIQIESLNGLSPSLSVYVCVCVCVCVGGCMRGRGAIFK